jgi:hypothetical protein
LGSLQNEEVKIRGYEQHFEQARVEAGARYMDWKKSTNPKEEKLAASLRKALSLRDRQDPEKFFNEAGESSERPSSWHLRILLEKIFVGCVDQTNLAHSSFKESLFQRSEACQMTKVL